MICNQALSDGAFYTLEFERESQKRCNVTIDIMQVPVAATEQGKALWLAEANLEPAGGGKLANREKRLPRKHAGKHPV